MTPVRAVIDTNVLLSLFAFGGARFEALRAAVEQRRVRCLTDGPCFEEFARMVASPVLTLDDDTRRAAVARYAACAEVIAGSGCDGALPRCADVDDQRFLELAVRGGAAWVLTLDRALLGVAPAMAVAAGVRVAVPRRLMEALVREGSTDT